MAIGRGLTGLVCGSWEGVGKAVALRLAREKINLILPAPSTNILSNVAKQARSLGASVFPVSVDSSCSASIGEGIAAGVSEVGPLSFLILSPQLINSHSPLNAAYVLTLARENYIYTCESLEHLKCSSNPHIITIAPHPTLTGEFFHEYDFGSKLLVGTTMGELSNRPCGWFENYFTGQMALLGITDPIRFRAIELINKDGVALNGLWPKNRIWTGGSSSVWSQNKSWYSANSLAESCVHILEQPAKQCWGNLLHDDTLLPNTYTHHAVPEFVDEPVEEEDDEITNREHRLHSPADINAPVNEDVVFFSPDPNNTNLLVAFYGLAHHTFTSRHVCQQVIRTLKPDALLLELSNTKRMHLAVSIRKEESLSEFQQAFRYAKTQIGKNCPVVLGDFVSFTLVPRPTVRMMFFAVAVIREMIKHFIKYCRTRSVGVLPWSSRHEWDMFLHTEYMYLMMVKTPTLCKHREQHITYKLQELVHSHRDVEKMTYIICLTGKAHIPGIIQYYGNVTEYEFDRIRFLPGLVRLVRDIVLLLVPVKRSEFNYVPSRGET